MKISLDINSKKILGCDNVSFGGYKVAKSDYGFKEFEISYPFDPNKDDCYIEVYKVDTDIDGNYYTTGRAYTKDGRDKVKIGPGKNRIDLTKTFGVDGNQPFAYHYLLIDKYGNDFPKVKVDAGDIIDERSSYNENRNIFNIVTPNKSSSSRGGAMKLVIVDSQHVGRVYNKQNKVDYDANLAKRGQNGIKSITNKFGGTLAGLEYGLDNGEYDSYSRIISLPIFTDDDFTAHAYWNKNCMQMASSLGNINNYASFQRKMFAHGLNFVSDGAFVNEGLNGVHFTHVLKWGDDSPYINWFRASSINDGPLSLGVFAKNKEHISHKIVNSPYTYIQEHNGHISIGKNHNYDKTKPTYIQFFDTRLVTPEESSDTTKRIRTYSKMSTENVYSLHSHNDSVFPYSFEIDPEAYNTNIKHLNEYNRRLPRHEYVRLGSYEAARILSKNEFFSVDGKHESGFETWDANPDIAKLNFVYSNADSLYLKNLPETERKEEKRKILRGNYQVQDYVVTSGKFWTRKTDDILRMYIAQNLKKVDPENPSLVYHQIERMANNEVFPKSVKAEVSKNEVENVLSGFYNNKRKLMDGDKKSQILAGLMDYPLDACEFGDNIVSVLASPLVSKRAVTKSEIGLSRYDVFSSGNKNLQPEYEKTYKAMDKIYTDEMYKFAQDVLGKVDSALPQNSKLFEGGEVTEYGQYVLPILTSEIAKYALIKSLVPNADVTVDKFNGEISYDYNKLKTVSLQSVGITDPASPTDEARMLLGKIKKGMSELSASSEDALVKGLVTSLKDTNLASFQLADLIIDKTQSGLDWRIDATKDIADVEALRNNNTNFEYTWQSITDFWKNFAEGVLAENPNSYLVAEVTNKEELHEKGMGGYTSKYNNVKDHAVQKFLRESGITSIAEYSHWFRDLSKMFGADFETGETFDNPKDLERKVFDKMMEYVKMGSLDSVRYAYTFIGNHDKPRALHCLALDMGLFYTDLMDNGNAKEFEYRRKAYQVINDKYLDYISDNEVNRYDFSRVSPKAVAMADAIRPAFINVLNDYRNKYPDKFGSDDQFNNVFIPISKAITDLANGVYKGESFDADAFGIKPIDVAVSMVLKQAKSEYGLSLPAGFDEKYENEVFEAIMTPALTKLLGIMKLLVAIPGLPTLFDGDDAGTTGYDTKTKNMFVQCRQRNHDEWLSEGSPKYKDFLKKYNKYLDDVMKVRKNPKCNALNNGSIHTLPLSYSQTGEAISSILRQSTDGRMAISVINPTGLHNDFRSNYSQNNIYLDKLYLDDPNGNVGVSGLREGLKFVNANNEKDIYYTRVDNGRYFIVRHIDGKDVPIPLHDTTLILYHVPEGGVPMTFTGSCMVKPSASVVANTYADKNCEKGKKLALIK